MKYFFITAFVFSVAHGGLAAQTGSSRDSVFPHSTLVVTAQRTSIPIRSAVSSISHLDRRTLNQRPVRTIAEAAQQVPGMAFVDFEGSGADPQLITRGFYGGGEADYVLLLLDGRPLNQVESGRVNWDLVPLSTVQSMEVLRGPASEVWGDAAIGGVINLITRGGGARGFGAAVSGGENGWLRASASQFGAIGERPLQAFGNYATSEGFRDHALRKSGGINAALALSGTPERGITISTFHDWRDVDDPGPLLDSELQASRTQSSPFYRFDNTNERHHRVALEGVTGLGGGALRTSLSGEHQFSDRIRTLRLASDFADTKARELSVTRLTGSAVLDRSFMAGKGTGVLGLDASYGRLRSEYFSVNQGPPDAYANTAAERGELDSHARGNRSTIAGFARYTAQLLPRLSASIGSRVDGLRDSFETDEATERETKSRFVASHRAGLNLGYADSETQRGHLYVSVAQSFKAATPDQLYDRRKIPVPFPPFAITFSSADLEPQRGTNYEAGIYHDAVLGSIEADLSLSAYQMAMKDEIDFDVSTLSYRNLGESRHRGLEAGLNLRQSSIAAFANYTLQSVTVQSGDNDGNFLKAIPRHFTVAGISAGNRGVLATLSFTSANGAYLDDANEQKIPSWNRWDLRGSYERGDLNLFLDLLNLADTEYSTTGFVDPAGSGGVYMYPAAGRSLQAGIRWRR